MIEEGLTDEPLSDERPVIDAPTAEQLSGEISVVPVSYTHLTLPTILLV